MSDETQEQAEAAFDPRSFWLNTLGLALGGDITILLIGAEQGVGFQGKLVDMVISGQTLCPMVVIIQQFEGMPRVNIPWAAIAMITQPPVAAGGSETLDLSVEDLIKFSDENGIEVPEEARALIAEQQ